MSVGRASAVVLPQSPEDLDLTERVKCALRATGHSPLRGIKVTVHAGFVIFGGRVPSYYVKQVAQATALIVAGVRHIRNDLDVIRPKPQYPDAR
jgi:osmotically-inducible protein OsmY